MDYSKCPTIDSIIIRYTKDVNGPNGEGLDGSMWTAFVDKIWKLFFSIESISHRLVLNNE